MANSKELNAIARFTSDGDVEICARRESLEDLSAILASNAIPLTLELQTSFDDPKPYQGYVTKILIEVGKGLVSIELKESHLVIAGAHEHLEVLSEDIDYLTNLGIQETGIEEHLHVEYYPDHPYLAPSSAALVVRRC